MATWHTKETARVDWIDAEAISDDLLDTLLEVARGQVLAYAPATALATGDPELDLELPARFALAQLRQAQNLYNAGRVDSDGGIGDGSDFVMRPHPLDWHIKAILRPNRGRAHVR